MPRKLHALALAATAALALALTAGHAASAAPVAGAGRAAVTAPASSLLLTIVPSEFGQPTSQVTLECFPTGGTHPEAERACQALTTAGGDFTRLTPAQGEFCTADVHPVTTFASGTWLGSPVSYQETFPNACDAAVWTDHVFKF